MHVAAIKPPKASTYEPAENSKGADALAKMAKLQTLRGTLSRLDPATNGPPVLNDTAATETQLDDFPAGWLHELWAPKAHDHTSAAAWALSALTVHDKPLLWITNHTLLREQGVPYGPGLMAAGLTPADFILVRARNQEDSLWALEEAIKSDAFGRAFKILCQDYFIVSGAHRVCR